MMLTASKYSCRGNNMQRLQRGDFLKICGAFLFIFLMTAPLVAQDMGAEIWKLELLSAPNDLITISDVTGDGYRDIVTGTDFSMVYCIKSFDGSLWWSFLANGTVWSLAGTGDVNFDGIEDVAVGTAFNEVQCISGGSAGGTGVELWKTSTLTGDVWALCSIGDINNDSRDEVIAGTAGNRVVCLSGENGSELWTAATTSDVWTLAACDDVTGDGIQEVIAGTAGNRVLLINGATGALVWQHNAGADVWKVRALGDVNNDGKADVIAGTALNQVLCLSGGSQGGSAELIWDLQTGGDVRALAASSDINGDGVMDVAAGSSDNRLYLINGATGGEIWSSNQGGEVFSIAPISDHDRDGTREIACGSAMSRVDCVSGAAGTSIWQYPYAAIGDVTHMVALPDITGDGADEVVAVTENGVVNCLTRANFKGVARFLVNQTATISSDGNFTAGAWNYAQSSWAVPEQSASGSLALEYPTANNEWLCICLYDDDAARWAGGIFVIRQEWAPRSGASSNGAIPMAKLPERAPAFDGMQTCGATGGSFRLAAWDYSLNSWSAEKDGEGSANLEYTLGSGDWVLLVVYDYNTAQWTEGIYMNRQDW